jgi:protocatechuate 3,4-dioxygenase, beta subunit
MSAFRKAFLSRAGFTKVCMFGLCMIFCIAVVASGPPPTPPAPADVSSVGVIASAGEPGERLVVFGQVMAPDGNTPVAGIIVYAYQTDSTGEYHNDANRVARLHGWARTDAQGHYEFRTIRPAPYPGRSIAAHIHFHVYGAGYPLQWTEELLFAGDKFLRPEEVAKSAALGKFANVQPLTKGADGALRCSFNIKVSSTTNYR